MERTQGIPNRMTGGLHVEFVIPQTRVLGYKYDKSAVIQMMSWVSSRQQTITQANDYAAY